MFDRILPRMRQLVRASEYVITAHAGEEMESDGLILFDISIAFSLAKLWKGKGTNRRWSANTLLKAKPWLARRRLSLLKLDRRANW